MSALPAFRRLSLAALAGAAAAVVGPAAATAQDEGCVFGDEGNDVYNQQTVPGGGIVTYVRRPHFVCPDGVQIWADSAVAYSAQSLSHLIGRVRYRDATRELTSSEARYFSDVGRLQAQGDVLVVDRADGSRVENGDLVYLRSTNFRDEEEMTVTTGADGVRPRATLPPPPPDSTGVAGPADPVAPDTSAAGRDHRPYTVVADRILFRGESYFSASGEVEIDRDSLLAFSDSAEYTEDSESLVLVGAARVVSSEYVLVGRTITMGTATAGENEIRAVREALLTGEDLTLRAPLIKLYLTDGSVDRLVAVSLTAEPDSADLARPVATAERFELTADSLDVSAPGEVVDRIYAVGRARSVSEARDTLNVEALPELARRDWLEGDTIVITLAEAPGDPSDPSAGDAEEPTREYEVEQIVARVGARSLYRLPAQDSTAQADVGLPAVHYVLGDEITIHMREGEVEEMEVVGQTRGVHLEPLGRVAPDSAQADSTGAQGPLAAPEADTTRLGQARSGGVDPPDQTDPRPDSTSARAEPWRRP